MWCSGGFIWRGSCVQTFGGSARTSCARLPLIFLSLSLLGCAAQEAPSQAIHFDPVEDDLHAGRVPEFLPGGPDFAADEGHGHGHGHDAVQVPYWAAEDPHIEHDNGHLWMVNRAIDLVAKRRGRTARATTALMRDSECEPVWQQGLIDADYLKEYNSGRADIMPLASIFRIAIAGASWEAHFFDPEKNANYNGNGDTAYTRALQYAADAAALLSCDEEADCAELRSQFRFEGSSFETACYAIGLSLHYTTDITQPMHSANFTAKDFPIQQHSHLEQYAMRIQDRFAPEYFNRSGATLDEVLMDGAWQAKAQWPRMSLAIKEAYQRNGCFPMRLYLFDDAKCWEDDEAVDAVIGEALSSGVRVTADALLSMRLTP